MSACRGFADSTTNASTSYPYVANSNFNASNANNGAFNLNVNNSPSNANANYGSRPAKSYRGERRSYARRRRAQVLRREAPSSAVTGTAGENMYRPASASKHQPKADAGTPKGVSETKSYGDLFMKTTGPLNIFEAVEMTKSVKRWTANYARFHEHLAANIARVSRELRAGTWRPHPYREFEVFNSHKRRKIEAPAYEDTIVHNAVVRVIEPLFDKTFVDESFACRTGYGTHRAVDLLRSHLRKAGNAYVLKCDLSKHFPTTWRETLRREWERRIREPEMVDLLELISFRQDVPPHSRGIPIGARPSQLNSNIALSPLDRFIRQCCKARYYVRYADDFVIIDRDKEALRNMMKDISWFLSTQNWQSLNPKSGIQKTSTGVDFCGYRVWATHTRPRKAVVKSFKRKLSRETDEARLQSLRASFMGYMKHCDGYTTTCSALCEKTGDNDQTVRR